MVSVTGAVGASDRVIDAFPGGPYFGVDLEFNSILVDFIRATLFSPPSLFDGIRISGIDDLVTGVSATGINPSRITFGAHEVYFNFQGMTFNAGQIVTATITTSVPEPASLALMGLAGLTVARRRKIA